MSKGLEIQIHDGSDDMRDAFISMSSLTGLLGTLAEQVLINDALGSQTDSQREAMSAAYLALHQELIRAAAPPLLLDALGITP